MVRETSIEAYEAIMANNLLHTSHREELYEALYRKGPLTANELWREVEPPKLEMVQYNVHSKLRELVKMRVVKECGTRKCSITGRRVILWDVTKELPVPIKKVKRRKCTHCNGTGLETVSSEVPSDIKDIVEREDWMKHFRL